MNEERLVVFSTAPNSAVAEELARHLLGEQLAACVNVIDGIRSIYRWEGEVHRDPEVLLVIKTDRAHLEPLTETLQNQHPYDCPEVVAVPIVGGSADYLGWLTDSLAVNPS